MARATAVFDKHTDPSAFADLLPGWTLLSAARSKPKLRYSGVFSDDEDYSHVLQLAWENDATLITCDGSMIEKATDFNHCGSRGHYLSGVVVLPPGRDRQRKTFAAFLDRKIQIANLERGEDPLEALRQGNFGVDLRAKQPEGLELCNCPFTVDEMRRRKRYKRK